MRWLKPCRSIREGVEEKSRRMSEILGSELESCVCVPGCEGQQWSGAKRLEQPTEEIDVGGEKTSCPRNSTQHDETRGRNNPDRK